ncbi:MAG: hypothetical protein WDN28_24205 [Chthoniobacter sp.]
MTESRWVRWLLIGFTLVFLILFLFLPLAAVFVEAFRKGTDMFFAAFKDADALSAIRLTFLAAGIAVPLNVVFGLAASWVIAKFSFPGKSLLLSFIDLPFAVIAGHLGPRLRAAFRRAGLDRPVAARA